MALLNRDVWARGVLARAGARYGLTAPALQAAQSIAHLEAGGGYGVAGSADPVWQGSNNWGAIKCSSGTGRPPCPEGCFEHADRDENGQAGIYCFRSYATPDDGAAALLHELLRRPRVAAVLASGSATAIALAMKAPPAYMGLSATAYARLIADRAKLVAKSLGEPLYVTLAGPSSNASAGDVVSLAFVGWALWKAYRGRKR
jgi:hypothetical protein